MTFERLTVPRNNLFLRCQCHVTSSHILQEKTVLTVSLFTFMTLVLNGDGVVFGVVKDHLFQKCSAHMVTVMHSLG